MKYVMDQNFYFFIERVIIITTSIREFLMRSVHCRIVVSSTHF
jgi:hypothetical protein